MGAFAPMPYPGSTPDIMKHFAMHNIQARPYIATSVHFVTSASMLV